MVPTQTAQRHSSGKEGRGRKGPTSRGFCLKDKLIGCELYNLFSLLGDPSTSPPLLRAAASKDLDEQSRKNVTGKNRGKRKADSSLPQDNELEVGVQYFPHYSFSVYKAVTNCDLLLSGRG